MFTYCIAMYKSFYYMLTIVILANGHSNETTLHVFVIVILDYIAIFLGCAHS